jgi:hypothetical protein
MYNTVMNTMIILVCSTYILILILILYLLQEYHRAENNHHRYRSSPEYLNGIIKTVAINTTLSVHNIIYNQ